MRCCSSVSALVPIDIAASMELCANHSQGDVTDILPSSNIPVVVDFVVVHAMK